MTVPEAEQALRVRLIDLRDRERWFRDEPGDHNAQALEDARSRLNLARRTLRKATEAARPNALPDMDALHRAIADEATVRTGHGRARVVIADPEALAREQLAHDYDVAAARDKRRIEEAKVWRARGRGANGEAP